MKIKKIIKKIREYGHYSGLSREEFSSIYPDLMASNKQSLYVYSMLLSVMMLILTAASFIVDSLEKNRLAYILALVVSGLIFAVSRRKGKQNYAVTYLCMYALLGLIAAFGINLGTFIEPNEVSVSFPVLMFVAPLLFADYQRNTNLYIALSVIAYSICAKLTQDPVMIGYNMSNIIPFSLAAVVISAYLMKIKVDRMILLREVNKASDAKTDFLANMSHEIRTPLNAVLGLTDLALREPMSEEAQGYVHQIKSSGKNLLVIINDILDYSKIASGKMALVEDEYEPLSVVNNLTSMINTRIGDKPVEFTIDISPDIPSRMVGDSVRIHQIILNLMTNAVKFTKTGEVNLTVENKKINEDTELLRFSINDTGQGIKEEDLHKLFNSFQQVDSKRNRNIEGTGLGLAICKQLVGLMNGDIGVNSVYGEGSTFWFEIPQKVVSRDPAIPVEKHDGLRIAVFSDNEVEKKHLERDLSAVNADFRFFRPSDAESELFDCEYDFIIVDDTAVSDDITSFIENNSNTKCIIVSSFTNPHAHSGLNAKIISKPVYVLNLYNSLGLSDVTLYSETDDSADIFSYHAPDAHVLIVDDNTVNLAVASGLLEPLGMQVDTAISGMDALEKCTALKYDVVFMDHMMPVIDGIETTHMIRESLPEYKDIPIIALTANAIGNARELFISEGLDDFVAKPIELKSILSKLTKWLPEDKLLKRDKAEADALRNSQNQAKTASLPEKSAPADVPFKSDIIPDMPELNIQKALSLLGDENLYMTVLRAYFADSAKNNESIRNRWETGDIKNYTIEVHSLKSTSRQIGADELGELAAELEMAGKDENLELINAKTEELLTMYKNVRAVIAAALGEEDSAEAVVSRPVTEILDELLEAVNSFDTLTIDELLEEMSAAEFTDEEKTLFEELKTAAEGCESDICEDISSRWKALAG